MLIYSSIQQTPAECLLHAGDPNMNKNPQYPHETCFLLGEADKIMWKSYDCGCGAFKACPQILWHSYVPIPECGWGLVTAATKENSVKWLCVTSKAMLEKAIPHPPALMAHSLSEPSCRAVGKPRPPGEATCRCPGWARWGCSCPWASTSTPGLWVRKILRWLQPHLTAKGWQPPQVSTA